MGMGELLLVLAIVMVLFGAKRLPELANGFTHAIRNFKRGMTADDEDVTPKQVAEQSSAKPLDTAAPESQSVEHKS